MKRTTCFTGSLMLNMDLLILLALAFQRGEAQTVVVQAAPAPDTRGNSDAPKGSVGALPDVVVSPVHIGSSSPQQWVQALREAGVVRFHFQPAAFLLISTA